MAGLVLKSSSVFQLNISAKLKFCASISATSPSRKTFYVECGLIYTNTFGDINEQFYLSIEGMFRDACKIIKKEKVEDNFKKRCLKIMTDTKNIGWGFHDQMSDYYYTFFEE